MMTTQRGTHRIDDVASTRRWTKAELDSVETSPSGIENATTTMLALLLFLGRHAAFSAYVIARCTHETRGPNDK